MIQSDRQQTVFVEFTETVEVPEHEHADQWEMVIAGIAELHREGRTEVSGPGDHFFVPAGQRHAATVHAGYKAVIVFDAPDRYPVKASDPWQNRRLPSCGSPALTSAAVLPT